MASSLLHELPLSTSTLDLGALEQKVIRAIELLGQARTARAEAEREAARLKAVVGDRDQQIDILEKELITLRKDRELAREQVEKIITQIDSLIAAESQA